MKIIEKKMSNLEKSELFSVMFDALEGAIDAGDKSLEFDEYFVVLEHFYEEDEEDEDGEGDLIGICMSSESSIFILNDETREDFETVFREARDYAIEKSTEEGEDE